MFGNNTKKDSRNDSSSSPSNTSAANSLNSLGAGTTVQGDIQSDSDIRIDGFLKGNLNCKGKLIIGPKGRIEGNVTCKNALIEGGLKGELNVTELLNVSDSAKIDGIVNTGQLLVDSGAHFNVSCTMGNQKIADPSAASQNGRKEPVLTFNK